MPPHRTAVPVAITAAVIITLTAPAALAQNLSIPWHVIGSGGGHAVGAAFTLNATIGQHAAGATLKGPSPAGNYSLTGGFWAGIAAVAPPACRVDFNADGTVDPDDLADYIGAFFSVPPAPGSDFNADGTTDPDDLADYIGAFFSSPC